MKNSTIWIAIGVTLLVTSSFSFATGFMFAAVAQAATGGTALLIAGIKKQFEVPTAVPRRRQRDQEL